MKRGSKSSLAILERAYRGSLEEQYGHIVWLSRVMKGMGADHALLLKGDTVMFARRDQPRTSLCIGDTVVNDVSHYAVQPRAADQISPALCGAPFTPPIGPLHEPPMVKTRPSPSVTLDW